MGTWTTVNPCLKARRFFANYGYQQNSIGIAGRYTGSSWTTEEYNGTSWSSAATLVINRNRACGAGGISDGLYFGGNVWGGSTTPTECSEYDGTSWSLVNSLNRGGYSAGACGHSQVAALKWGGYTSNKTEEYNGTSWSFSNDFLSSSFNIGGSGTLNNALSVGDTSDLTHTVEYNGTTWSALANTAENHSVNTVLGNPDAAIVGGSSTSPYAQTEEFNGTSWSNENSLNAGRYEALPNGGGSHEAGITVGGYDGSVLQSTEEWDDVPICWNYTARYLNSNKLFKLSGCGSYPKHLRLPSNVDKSTGKLIDDGRLIDPDSYEVE